MYQLKSFLNAIYPLPQSDFDELVSRFKKVEFKRKALITLAGDVEQNLYFVVEGIQRSFSIVDDKEHVMAFTYPPSFTGVPDSFFNQTPSNYFLECLTPSTLLKISFESMSELVEKHRSIERLMRKATEGLLAGVIQRHHELLALKAEQRFTVFLKRSPHLLNKIPHKYLASYLGIDPTNFSKLLNQVKV